MLLYQQLLLPLLSRIDAETVHERTLAALSLAHNRWLGRLLLRGLAGRVPPQPVELFGLTFPNVLGMAAGFDKDVRVAAALAELGFGHVEVGTLTPRPQPGNPRPRLFRLPDEGALINRMGFPNEGAAAAVPRLWQLSRAGRRFILGVSLGKQKETPLEEAAADYIAVMSAVYPYADYLAVNVSSPNTPGLRALQGGDYVSRLLNQLQATGQQLAAKHALTRQRPLLLKIAPDLTLTELEVILDAAEANQISGIIATNTTVNRDGLRERRQSEAGGLSGEPLRSRSNELIGAIASRSDLPIIGVGGVRTAADVQAKLDAGASLVQLYTALVYEGPRLPGRLLRRLAGGRV